MNTVFKGFILQIIMVLHLVCFGAEESAQGNAGAYLGVFAYEVNSPVLRKQLQLPQKTGLLIVAVADNSPAKAAGLQVYDILLQLDTIPLTDMNQLRQLIGAKQPGDSISLTVLSEGKKKAIRPVLGTRPALPITPSTTESAEQQPTTSGNIKRSPPSYATSKMILEIDLDELIRIASDPDLSQREKKQKVNALVTRDLLKGLRLKTFEHHTEKREADLLKQIERALAPLPPATQEQLRQRIFDKDGKVKRSVNILETDKGPLIIVEEPATLDSTKMPKKE